MTGQKNDKEHSTQGDSVLSTLHMSADPHIPQGSYGRLSISNRTFNNNISGLAENVSTDNIDINLLTDLREPEKLELKPTSGRSDKNDKKHSYKCSDATLTSRKQHYSNHQDRLSVT